MEDIIRKSVQVVIKLEIGFDQQPADDPMDYIGPELRRRLHTDIGRDLRNPRLTIHSITEDTQTDE